MDSPETHTLLARASYLATHSGSTNRIMIILMLIAFAVIGAFVFWTQRKHAMEKHDNQQIREQE